MVPKNLRQLRGHIDSRFESRNAFARKVPCSPAMVTRVLAGARGVSEDMAVAWADALNKAHGTDQFTADTLFERSVVSARPRRRRMPAASADPVGSAAHSMVAEQGVA